MKILIVGNWRSLIHEEPLKHGLIKNKCVVEEFKWHTYFSSSSNVFLNYLRRFLYKMTIGPDVKKVNQDIISLMKEKKFDAIFFYRPNIINWKTIFNIKKKHPLIIIAAYNNDNPFSNKYRWYSWLKFTKAIPFYDIIFSYRPQNIEQYKKKGAKKVFLLPPWFDPTLNYPVKYTSMKEKNYKYNLVFIGHYENDGRIDLIRRIVLEGFEFSLFGPGWNNVIKNDKILSKFYPVNNLTILDYNKVLNYSDLALVIYSGLNEDVYTRRCFEIPATKTPMIAKRTNEMMDLYEEDKEVIFFSNEDELISKLKFYSNNRDLLKSIGIQGYKRAFKSGYDIYSRSRYLLSKLKKKQMSYKQN